MSHKKSFQIKELNLESLLDNFLEPYKSKN